MAITIRLIMVTFDESGNRIETPWELVPDEEKSVIAQRFTDNCMRAIGYERVEAVKQEETR